ncbi:MAG: hypothetical protein ACJAYE_001030 [Candidatus Azotimanducaceae bacterium]|jgi:hypothetical protein
MPKQTSLPPDSELLALQTHFTQHLRNPDTYPVPEGLDERRVGIYSELIFHNISALMSEFFPVLKQMLTAGDWDQLIREFFINWRAKTPYFPRLAEEFLAFLMSRPGTNHEPDYLLPLAHYEWLELYLYIHEDELPRQPLDEGTLNTAYLKLSELAVPAAYQFPVHQIHSDWDEQEAATYLLVFRDNTDSIRFFELAPLAYELLSAISDSEEGVIAADWLKEKARELGQDETSFITFGLELLKQFNRENLIYVFAH